MQKKKRMEKEQYGFNNVNSFNSFNHVLFSQNEEIKKS